MKKENFNLLFALLSCLSIGTGITIIPLLENKSQSELEFIVENTELNQPLGAPDEVPMESIIVGGYDVALSASATEYNYLQGGYSWGTASGVKQQIVSTSGTFSNLQVKLATAPSSGDSYTFTIYDVTNTADIGDLTLTISDTNTMGTSTGTAMVNASDCIALKVVPDSTPDIGFASWSIVFTSVNTSESLLLGGWYNVLTAGDPGRFSVLQGGMGWYANENDRYQVVPTDGKIKNLYIQTEENSLGGYTNFTVYKNSVATSLYVNLSNTATKTGNNVVDEVSVNRGDWVSIRCAVGASTTIGYAIWGTTFVADVNGESIIMHGHNDPASGLAKEYIQISSYAGSWEVDGSEPDTYSLISNCTLRNLTMKLWLPPLDADDGWVFTVRTNASDSALNCTFGEDDSTSTDNDSIWIADYTTINMQCYPVGTPRNTDAGWGITCYLEPELYLRTWQNISYGYLTGGNITSFTNTSYGYLTGANVSSYVNLSYGYLTGGNTSLPPIVFTNETPSNSSTGQELGLTWNTTIEHSYGGTFDWWINCSNGQSSQGFGSLLYNTPSLPSSGPFEEKWNVSMIDAGISSIANPTIQDIDGDGYMEIFMGGKTNFTVGETDSILLLTCINGTTGETIRNITYDSGYAGSGNNYFNTLVYDFNKDGVYEVIVDSGAGPTVMRNTSDFTDEIWNETAVATGWHQQAYVDNGDNVTLYLVGSGNDNPDSSFIKKVNGSTGVIEDSVYHDYTCFGGVSIADLDGDGHYELFVTARAEDGGLRCFNATDLSLKWEKNFILCSSQTATIADFDKDGDLEVMVVDQGWPYHAFIYDADGVEEHESSVRLDHHHQSAVGDVDNDGNLELVCGDMTAPKIYDLYTHELEDNIPSWELISHSGEIYDVIPDDNNVNEILNTGDQGSVTANMASMWQYNVTTDVYDKVYEFGHRVVWSVSADVDFDGYKEIIMGYCSNWAFGKSISYYWCYETNAPVDIPAPITSMAFGGTRRLNNDEFIAPPGEYEYITYGEGNGSKELILTGLDYSTEYTLWVNATDGTNWTREWFKFTTKADPNDPPIIKNPIPSNNTGDQEIAFTWNVTIEDPEGSTFDWWINCSDGSTSNASSASNGTKGISLSGLSYNTEYKVWVNATDGNGWTRRWYNFTTVPENVAPTIESPTPANNSINQPISLDWSVFINDSDIEDFNWWINSSNGQRSSWYDSRYIGASQTENDGTQSFEDDIIGIPWNMTGDTRARASNISIRWYASTHAKNVTCALYDENMVLILETEERLLPVESATWEPLNFPDPGPILEPNTKYYIVAFVQKHLGSGSITYDWSSGDNSTAWIQSEYGYNSSGGQLPGTWTPVQWGNDSRTVHIRCYYNSTLNGTKNVSLSGLSYSTEYNLWVNATDGTEWTNKTYNFTTRDPIAWHNLSYGYLTGGNITSHTNISYGYLTGGNTTRLWNNNSYGYLTGGNVSSHVNLSYGYLTGGNTTAGIWNNNSYGYLTGGNVSLYVNLSYGYLTGGNTSLQPTACFTYRIVGANIYTTSCSTNTNNGTDYKWESSDDGTNYGTTNWITGIRGETYIFTYPEGGNICIRFTVRNGNEEDLTIQCIGDMQQNKDIYDPDYYNVRSACEDAGYFWYNDQCNEDPEPLPWNVKEDPPEAGGHDRYAITLGEFKIHWVYFVILGIILLIGLSMRKKKKNKRW